MPEKEYKPTIELSTNFFYQYEFKYFLAYYEFLNIKK